MRGEEPREPRRPAALWAGHDDLRVPREIHRPPVHGVPPQRKGPIHRLRQPLQRRVFHLHRAVTVVARSLRRKAGGSPRARPHTSAAAPASARRRILRIAALRSKSAAPMCIDSNLERESRGGGFWPLWARRRDQPNGGGFFGRWRSDLRCQKPHPYSPGSPSVVGAR